MNMKKGDIIYIRVKAQRTVRAKSWENASVIKILDYLEYPSTKNSEFEIISNSPYSKVQK